MDKNDVLCDKKILKELIIYKVKNEKSIGYTVQSVLAEIPKYLNTNTSKIEYLSKSIKGELVNLLSCFSQGDIIALINEIKESLFYLHYVNGCYSAEDTNFSNIIPFIKYCTGNNLQNSKNIEINYKKISGVIGKIVDMSFILYYASVNCDLLYQNDENKLENYSIEELLTKNIYPDHYEEFYDSEYILMESIKKPETCGIKNKFLKQFSEKDSISSEDISKEIDEFFNLNYGFKLIDLDNFINELYPLNDEPVMRVGECSKWSNVLEFISAKMNFDFKDDIQLMRYYELHPVTKVKTEYVFGKAQTYYICDLLRNLLFSGDSQFFDYMNYNKTNVEQLKGRISTFCERKALYVLSERLYEKGYVFPMFMFKEEKIPVADINKIEDFNLGKTKFDSDLFFADQKRKIIYNIDLKYLNAIPSVKLGYQKGKNKVDKFLKILKERHEYILQSFNMLKEILDIEDITEYKLISCLCTVRPNYYCYENKQLFDEIKYTNWFKIIDNLNNERRII